ncbi:MAG: flagellar motor switch protein FliN [Planctomycetes bacterium]|nr:flagellar motor switch protein FliN [Planctomycetota bacterium]
MPEELSQEDIDALLAGASDGGGLGGDLGGGDLSAILGGGSSDRWDLPDLGGGSSGVVEASSLDMLYDVELQVKIELGRTYMTVEDILRLREGSVIQLDKDAGAPVDILINGRFVAEGEVLVLNDYFCVRVTKILSDQDRRIVKR